MIPHGGKGCFGAREGVCFGAGRTLCLLSTCADVAADRIIGREERRRKSVCPQEGRRWHFKGDLCSKNGVFDISILIIQSVVFLKNGKYYNCIDKNEQK